VFRTRQPYDSASAPARTLGVGAVPAVVILLLMPAAPLIGQETGTQAAGADAASPDAASPEADSAQVASTGADSTWAAPNPHEGFDFPSAEVMAAAEAGLAWLELVDAGEFNECWTSGSAVLQSSGSPQRLKAAINDGRQAYRPLGPRSLVGTQELYDPPNAPPGRYVMLQYRTEASGDRSIMETVVPRWEGGAWRVAGYFIRRD